MTRARVNKPGAARAAPVTTPAPEAAAKPSEQIIADALKESTITDERGRKIVLGRPSPFAGPKLALAVGAEAASNSAFMQMVEPITYVKKIGDDFVAFPTTMTEVEVIHERLGHDGMDAVTVWYMTYVFQPMIDRIKDAQDNARLKN